MASTSGTFAAPGVSASIAATATVTLTATGLAHRCDLLIEQSVDSGVTWVGWRGVDRALAPLRKGESAYALGWGVSSLDPTQVGPCSDPGEGEAGPQVALAYPAPAGLYRLRCTSFGSGSCAYTLSST